jgi:hypothetical protein
MMTEFIARISRWMTPTALFAASSERNELEQTSSARLSVLCASVPRPGLCDLPGGLAAREAAAYDMDRFHAAACHKGSPMRQLSLRRLAKAIERQRPHRLSRKKANRQH